MLRVVLVLWYKDGMGKPSYSFDLRERVGQLKVIRAMESSGRYGEKDIPNTEFRTKLYSQKQNTFSENIFFSIYSCLKYFVQKEYSTRTRQMYICTFTICTSVQTDICTCTIDTIGTIVQV